MKADTQIWIDVLLSAGVQVEVCKVKAKDASSATLKKRKASTDAVVSETSRKTSKSAKSSRTNGWGKMKEYDWGSEDEMEQDGDEEDEWVNESGEEGKPEGHLERRV